MVQQIEASKKALNELLEKNKVLMTRIMNGNALKKKLTDVYNKIMRYGQMNDKEKRKVEKALLSGDRGLPRSEGRAQPQLSDPCRQQLPRAVQERVPAEVPEPQGVLISSKGKSSSARLWTRSSRSKSRSSSISTTKA